MAKRQREWARRTRDRLFDELGRWCRRCHTTEKLEFDLIHPLGDQHHKMEWSHRMSFYRRQHEANNLQVLCQRCNAQKQAQLELTEYQQVDQPF